MTLRRSEPVRKRSEKNLLAGTSRSEAAADKSRGKSAAKKIVIKRTDDNEDAIFDLKDHLQTLKHQREHGWKEETDSPSLRHYSQEARNARLDNDAFTDPADCER